MVVQLVVNQESMLYNPVVQLETGPVKRLEDNPQGCQKPSDMGIAYEELGVSESEETGIES